MYLADIPEGMLRPLTKITIHCREHGPFLETAIGHILGYGCPICDEKDPDSLNEKLEQSYAKLIAD